MTDQPGFAAVMARNGLAYSVSYLAPGVVGTFRDPAGRSQMAGRNGRLGDNTCMKTPRNLDFALIGNCRVAALVDTNARIVWWCFPRFDSDPVFSRLLAGDEEKGFCDVVLADQVESSASYLRNTAIVETILKDSQGGVVKVTDFVPRFEHYERIFRPSQIIRRIEPIAGLPRITIRVRPTYDYGRPVTENAIGSNHIRYMGGADVVRLTTDAPLSYIEHETSFALNRTVTLVFGPDEPFRSALDTTAREFLDRTRDYWLDWVRYLALPFEWQTAVSARRDHAEALLLRGDRRHRRGPHDLDPRSAGVDPQLGLSLLLAARRLLRRPRAQPAGRHPDDGILHQLHHHHRARPGHLPAAGARHHSRHAARRVDRPRPRRVSRQQAGAGRQRRGRRRCSTTSTAASCSAPTQMFVDERLPKMGDEALFRRLEQLGRQAAKFAFEPDAGIWEYRGRAARPHLFGDAVLGGLRSARPDRGAARPAHRGRHLDQRGGPAEAAHPRGIVERGARARSSAPGACRTSTPACCCFPNSACCDATDPRFVKTCDAIGRELMRNGRIMRYTAEDDFGPPETAFLVCNFWYIDALGADRPARGGARAVPRRPVAPQRLRHPVRGSRRGHRRALGQFPADLLDGGHHQHGDAAVSELGGRLVPRLVIVSNRVAVPEPGSRRRPAAWRSRCMRR